jgi:hypothetical protein
MESVQKQIERANSRGVGQFHVFVGNQYRSTWRTLTVAEVVAKKCGGIVYNSDSNKVA